MQIFFKNSLKMFKKTTLLLIGSLFLFLSSCSKDKYITNEPTASIKTFTASEMQSTQKLMFQDDEPSEILFDGAKRGFYLKEMLQIEGIGDNKFRIRNFLPHDFKNVTIYFKMETLPNAVKIMSFDLIEGLAEFEGELPFTSDEVRFEDEKGNIVGLRNLNHLNKGGFTLSIRCDDDLLEKLKTIKHKTFVRFHDYTSSGNWGTTTAEHCRLYLPLLANMAYLYSSSTFEQAFYNYEPTLYDNSKNPIDRKAVYQRFFSVANQNLGVTAKVEGLGGGAVFGIHQRMLTLDHFYQKGSINRDGKVVAGSREAWAHEYGHVLGFSHDSNMTYQGTFDGVKGGYVQIVMDVYEAMMFTDKELPFLTNPYK